MDIITISTELLGNIALYVGGSYIAVYGLKKIFEKIKI
jgi:hypothetical protein